MEELREVLNWLMENWHIASAVIVAVLGYIFGKSKVNKKLNDVKDIFARVVHIFETVKEALEDKELSKEETEEIKQDIDKLIADFKDLFRN